MIGRIGGVGSYGMGGVGSFYQSQLNERLRNAHSTQNAQQTRQNPVYTAKQTPSLETPVQPVARTKAISQNEASLPELTSRLENDPAAMAGRMRTRYGDVGPDGSFLERGGAAESTGAPALDARLNALQGQLSKAENALAKDDLDAAEGALTKGLPGQKAEAKEVEIPGLPKQDEKAGGAAANIEPTGAESAQEAAEEGECQTCEHRKYMDGSDDMGVSFQTPTNIKPEQAASAVRGHEMEHVYREQAKAAREGREVVSQNVVMHTEICPECGESFVSGGTTTTVTKAATDNDVQDGQQNNQDDVQFNGAARNENAPESVPGTPDNASKAVEKNDGKKDADGARQDALLQNLLQQIQKARTPFSAIA